MRRLLVAAALAAGCGGAPPAQGPDLGIRVVAPPGEVEFGRGFPLEVVRTWPRGLDPAPWSDDALTPLVLRAEGASVREDATRVEETRRFVAHAFALDEVRVPAPRFEARPRDGGAARGAAGAPLVIRVRPSLDRAAPGAPEPPGGLRSGRGPGAGWIAGLALAALAAGALLLRAGRARPVAAAAAPARPAPAGSAAERALARLERLRGSADDDPAGARAFHEEAAAALRDWLEAGPGVGTRCRTTEEVAADPATARLLGPARAAALRNALARCDLAKFAGAAPGAAARARLLDDAAAVVRGGGAA